MAFEEDFLELMPTTLTILNKTGQDQHGNDTYGDTVTLRCRVDTQPWTNRGQGVQHEQADPYTRVDAVIIGPISSPAVGLDAKTTLPSGKTLIIHTVEIEDDEDGPHHQVLSGRTENP